jgi:proteasome beta subunit
VIQISTEVMKTGTTTVGIVCKDGVVLAADQKATMGNIIASKEAQKVFKITDRIGMTIAGSVGDAQAMVRLLKAEMKLYEFEQGDVTVKSAATLLGNILRASYKSFVPELVQLVIGGYDREGPHIFSLDAAGGISEEKDFTFSGSGSVIAVGVLEDQYRKDISVDEGVDFLVRAIRAARERDVFSGGRSMSVLVITKDGFKEIPPQEFEKKLKGSA